MNNGSYEMFCDGSAGSVRDTVTAPASAQKKYDPGVSDSEIKIGQTMPFSGPARPTPLSGRLRPPISA